MEPITSKQKPQPFISLKYFTGVRKALRDKQSRYIQEADPGGWRCGGR